MAPKRESGSNVREVRTPTPTYPHDLTKREPESIKLVPLTELIPNLSKPALPDSISRVEEMFRQLRSGGKD